MSYRRNSEDDGPMMWNLVEGIIMNVLTLVALVGALVMIAWEVTRDFFKKLTGI